MSSKSLNFDGYKKEYNRFYKLYAMGKLGI